MVPRRTFTGQFILTMQSQLETLKAGMDGFERVLKKYNAFPDRQKK